MYCTVPIAYEGLRQNWEGKSPYAIGDALGLGWAKTDLGVYGSGHIGFLASLIKKTDIEGIIMWDYMATDFSTLPLIPHILSITPIGKGRR